MSWGRGGSASPDSLAWLRPRPACLLQGLGAAKAAGAGPCCLPGALELAARSPGAGGTATMLSRRLSTRTGGRPGWGHGDRTARLPDAPELGVLWPCCPGSVGIEAAAHWSWCLTPHPPAPGHPALGPGGRVGGVWGSCGGGGDRRGGRERGTRGGVGS